MAINNLNPRRVVWFSPNEPSNKYDIWLSRNAHYNENGEPTTDSNSQRDCDYIFKIYDCGKWNPIVGFNTTAANKIDIVEGNTLYHPAIFTGENPNDLYDAGSLGDLLKDTHFVTEGDWNDIYNEYIKTIIEQYPFDLWRATPTNLGGVCANTFDTIAANGFAECKFYNNSDNKLYVSGADILDAISESQGGSVDPGVLYRSFYNSPTILKGWSDDLTSALKPRFELAGSRVVDNRGKVPMLRNDDWWSTHGSGYTGDYDDTNCAFTWIDPYDPELITIQLEDILQNTASIGWTLFGTVLNPAGLQPEIYNVNYANRGRYLRIRPDFDGNIPSEGWTSVNCAVEWVNLPEGTVYTQGTGITISQQNEISINTIGALTNQVLTKIANGVGWSTPSLLIQYTGTNLIKVNSSNNEIGINMDSNPSSGDIIICDSGVAKWGAVPNPTIGGMSINCNNGGVTLNNLQLTSDTSITIDEEQSSSRAVYNLSTWNYYNLSNCKTLSITSVADTMEPVYIRIISAPYRITCNGDKIDIGSVLTDTSQKDILVTLQFGIAKFEEII